VGTRPTDPSFQTVVDLGLRDVGVRRRLLPLALWMSSHAPAMVVRLSADGVHPAAWALAAPFVLPLLLALALMPHVVLVPGFVVSAITVLLGRRALRRVPEVLRELRPLLAADESVLGDGVGAGERRWPHALRVVVATDRRLMVAAGPGASEPFLLVDAPYERVTRAEVEWKGRAGSLSLTVAGDHGAASDTNVVAIASPNLLSIALALRAHGVPVADPGGLAAAERAWDEVRRREDARQPLLDRAAMDTRDFDRGLWLLLGLSAIAFYGNLLGPFGLLLVFAASCVVCGYLSGTTSSRAYLVPVNLLLSPMFLFLDAGEAIGLMVVLSGVAALCLWAGAALRASAGPLAGEPAGPEARPARGSLRYAIGGLGLIRITGLMLAATLSLVVVTSAAGFELTSLRLALDQARAKELPVDGRSNLTGNAAVLTYTPSRDLRELVTDRISDDAPYDGARWELRSPVTEGYNVVSLAHYVEDPRLDDPAAIAKFVARKDGEHSRLAGFHVTHTRTVVAGRTAYVWDHEGRSGYWFYAAWFPQPVHTVRVECIARDEKARFKRLCAQAMKSLRFQY
jgi:uncharacterized membrane-anchored protein